MRRSRRRWSPPVAAKITSDRDRMIARSRRAASALGDGVRLHAGRFEHDGVATRTFD
jgi:hypothetical protein